MECINGKTIGKCGEQNNANGKRLDHKAYPPLIRSGSALVSHQLPKLSVLADIETCILLTVSTTRQITHAKPSKSVNTFTSIKAVLESNNILNHQSLIITNPSLTQSVLHITHSLTKLDSNPDASRGRTSPNPFQSSGTTTIPTQ